MPTSDLEREYERLRHELEAAYAAPVWNSVQIDRIANAIARIEHSFQRLSRIGQALVSVKSSSARQLDMSQA